MEYESGHSEDDKRYMLEDNDMESSDNDFSDSSEDDTHVTTVVGWTFVTDPFSDHCEASLKEYHINSLIFTLPFSYLMLNLRLTILKSLKTTVPYLCLINKQAKKYFEDISHKPIKVYELNGVLFKWTKCTQSSLSLIHI